MMVPDLDVPNTLNFPTSAAWGASLETPGDVAEAKHEADKLGLPFLCLGSGSNVVLMPHLKRFVGRISNRAIQVLDTDTDWVDVNVGAGLLWQDLVEISLSEGWFGLENLALIPGTVGAAPVQNIGAYGAELGTFVVAVTIVDDGGQIHRLNAEACGFGYRDSVFKQQPNWTITDVTLRLFRHPRVNLRYEALRSHFSGQTPSPHAVAAFVTALRQDKLPDPATHPNVGSFFKNPMISPDDADRLRQLGLDLFPQGDQVKASAAQLIDRSGCKEYRVGSIACWPRQPLVFVNYGGGTATDLIEFADQVQRRVADQYAIQLEREPSVVS